MNSPNSSAGTADAAAALAAAGWRVFPLKPVSKLPAIKGWPTLATSDVATVVNWWKQWPNAGIAIATGGGVAVLDVDCKNGAQGYASLAAIEAAHGPLPPTLTVDTPSGGRHYYFAAQGLRTSAGQLAVGLDIRGEGGYVVAPPTVLADGRAYRWVHVAAPAMAPAWIAAASAHASTELRPAPASADVTPELLEDLRSALDALPADSRTDWIAVGAALRPLGDVGRNLWIAWSATSPKHNPDADPEAWDTIGHDSTGPAAVFARAQRLGWQNPQALRRLAEVFGGNASPIAPGATLRPVPVHDVMTATVPPPRFIVHPLIPAGHLTLFGSHGGSGKSILALTIGAHVAAGQPWAGFAVERRPVLYVSLEDAGPVVRYRLRKVIEAYGLDATAVTGGLRIVDGAEGFGALMSENIAFGVRQLVETPTLAELRAAVGDAGLIVVDNASDAYDGPENDRRQVRTFIRALASLGRKDGAGVLLLAHIDKAAARFGSAGNSYSGSSAWHNSARSRLALVDERHGKELRQEKLNLGKAAAPVRLTWTDHGVLVPSAGEAAGPGDAQGTTDALAVLAAIEAATRDGVSVPTSRTGPATAQRVLESLPDLPAHLRGARGREDFWTAVTDLQRSGRITVAEYLNDSRHRREKFVVRQCASSAPVSEPTQTREPAQGTRASAPVHAQGVWGIGARTEPAQESLP